MLTKLFEQFILEKTYIRNCAPSTIEYYWKAFKSYQFVIPHLNLPDKETLTNYVVRVRENGMSVGCANTYIRALNSFLTWLHENEYLAEKLRIKLLKQEKKVMRSFTDYELKQIVSYRPKRLTGARLHGLLCTLIDTGCRIEEVITMRRNNVDFDSMLIKVVGKGSKERVVPISIELRRILSRFLNRHEFDYVFPSRDGKKLNYKNVYREFQDLCKKLKIDHEGFHCFRRTFARNYVKRGGNLIYLQAALGHSKLETTRIYVEVETDDLKDMHLRTSILGRL